jgi:DNA modification methylase
MTLAYHDDWLTIHGGDCRTVLAELPGESVHCVVTSPPYWGLRDYGTATWVGGDEDCDHLGPPRNQSDTSTLGIYADGTSRYKDGWKPELQAKQVAMGSPYKGTCGKCGATRIDSQLGLEPTPEQYVENMVAVFREVRRVLRSDGTVWLNLGDSYASGDRGRYDGDDKLAARAGSHRAPQPLGLKPKDLVGIPWRVAFALQADGWYLRSDIIWSKPNPMPESVTDRPTKSHEYLFLLSKSPRYYFDNEAVRLPISPHNDGTVSVKEMDGYRSLREGLDNSRTQTTRTYETIKGANIRSVWTVATQPYPGAHFAVFPEKLVEPCILAGTSQRGVCPECGAPWLRMVERQSVAGSSHDWRDRWPPTTPGHNTVQRGRIQVSSKTSGWRPSCAHLSEYHEHVAGDRHEHEFDGPHSHGGVTALRTEAAPPDPIPAVVLDPFGGSGTTARVANRLSRRAILIDLNPEYLRQQMDRNRDIPLGLEIA